MTDTLMVRRIATILGVVLVIALGIGAIRAAASWTASAAPLTVAPVSATALQARLVDEQARSAALLEQLQALDARSQDLAAALEEAHGRIATDTDHAKDLTAELKAAKAKLAKLEAAIARARSALAARSSGSAAAAVAAPRRESGHDEHEEEHEEPEHDEH
jgi:DNA repair exonuclease SbcCD ATPase subunit